MAINLTDSLNAATTKGKLAEARQVFLDGDERNVQQAIESIEADIKQLTEGDGGSFDELKTSIINETRNREAADNSLGERIDGLEKNIEDEAKARESGDANTLTKATEMIEQKGAEYEKKLEDSAKLFQNILNEKIPESGSDAEIDAYPTEGSGKMVSSGGVYAALTGIEEKVNNIDIFVSGLNKKVTQDDKELIWGYYLNKEGSLVKSSTWGRFEVFLKKGQHILVKTQGTNCCIIAKGINENYTVLVTASSAVKESYEYDVEEDGFYSLFVRYDESNDAVIQISERRPNIGTINDKNLADYSNINIIGLDTVMYRYNNSQNGIRFNKNTVYITKDGFGVFVDGNVYYIADVNSEKEYSFTMYNSAGSVMLINKDVLIANKRVSPEEALVVVALNVYSTNKYTTYANYIPFIIETGRNLSLVGNAVTLKEPESDNPDFVKKNELKTINGISLIGEGNINVQSSNTSVGVSEDYDCYNTRKNIKDYYFSYNEDSPSQEEDEYLDGIINRVPDDKKVIFFTDVHWGGYNWTGKQGKEYEGISTPIMLYCKKKLNIKNVIFGGDVLMENKPVNQTLLLARRFMNNVLSAFGKDMLYTRGNHDLNRVTGSNPTEYLLDYKSTYPIYNKYLNGTVVFDNSLIDFFESSSYSKEEKEEFLSYAKGHYYYDDNINKVRYIVVDTGAIINNSALSSYVTETTQLELQYSFLYNALISSPEDYDIIVVGHALLSYSNGYVAVGSKLKLFRILSAFKAKRSVTLSYSNDFTSNANKGKTNFDFTSVKHTDRIIFALCGDSHHDASAICQTNGGTYESVPYYESVQQADDAIIAINTMCEVCGGVGSSTGGNSTTFTMEQGTITELAFDIVSWNNKEIRCTRVGAGIDRTFQLNN